MRVDVLLAVGPCDGLLAGARPVLDVVRMKSDFVVAVH